MKTAILTDSTSDIPHDLAAERDIRICPLYVIWGDEALKDGLDIKPDAFYERLTRESMLATTSQPTPADFLHMYQTLAEEGYDEIVVFTISKDASGTYNSATTAAPAAPVPVHVLDTRQISSGEALIALAAADARDAGADAQGILEAAEHVLDKTWVLFTVDSLDYLHKGGRIGGARRLFGTILNIKPLLWVNEGAVDAFGQVRSRKRALSAVIDKAEELLIPGLPVAKAFVMHATAPEDQKAMVPRIRERLNPEVLIEGRVGPVVGAHTGPTILGIAFLQR